VILRAGSIPRETLSEGGEKILLSTLVHGHMTEVNLVVIGGTKGAVPV